jgi:hypothetical protein
MTSDQCYWTEYSATDFDRSATRPQGWYYRLLVVVTKAQFGLGILLAAYTGSSSGFSEEPRPVDFQRDIRPLLSDRCFHCHGPDEAHRAADLRLDQEQSLHAVAIAGEAENSELLRRVLSSDPDEMMPPPDMHKPLSSQEKELLEAWISQGANWSQHWAYERPRRWPVPEDSNNLWPANWVDHFLWDAMKRQQLLPAPEADRVTLLRRLSFDLTGLPPAPSMLNTQLDSDEEYQQVIEQLLNSPHFGERIAMYWLDLVRYADTVGYHGDQDHSISPYRDWVIDAFNSGMPFDQMTRDQLAGDLTSQPTLSQRIATGYNRLLQTTHEGGLQPSEYRAIYAADRVRNLSSIWLGATVGCAQCHDHKFDPFTMRDFYSLAAFFADVDDESHFKTGSNDLPTRRDPEIELPTPDQEAQLSALAREISELEHQLASSNLLSGELSSGELSSGELSAEQMQGLQDRKKAAESERKSLRSKVRRSMITAALAQPRTVRILPRGNWMDESGPEVQPAFPEFLSFSPDDHRSDQRLLPPSDRRLNRLDLAAWLVDPHNGVGLLTARVMVNRLWYLFFGTGIARDLSDFGGQGQPPTHPELLDNLAYHLVDSGWDIRATIRLLVNSRAYRQSSAVTEEVQRLDPTNRWFARQAAYRLPAEMIRDNALEVSGLLVKSLGGPSSRPYQPAGYYRHLNFPIRDYHSDSDQNQWRRGVYVHWQRQFLHPMLRAFDATNREECTAERTRSNTPLAALTLLNDPSFVEAARAMAELALNPENQAAQGDDLQRLTWLYQRATGRQPDENQLVLIEQLLSLNRRAFGDHPESAHELLNTGIRPVGADIDKVELAAWSEVCRALLNLAETNMRY